MRGSTWEFSPKVVSRKKKNVVHIINCVQQYHIKEYIIEMPNVSKLHGKSGLEYMWLTEQIIFCEILIIQNLSHSSYQFHLSNQLVN